MLDIQEQQRQDTRPRLEVTTAHTRSELIDAQRLRWRVFAEEMGARLSAPRRGIDSDRFDTFCDHLIVRDRHSGDVVGTYRMLNPAQARAAGGLYADTEFDLARLDHLRPELLELGRACVHPDYRGGAVMALLWAGVAQYMQAQGLRYLIGCASLSLADGGHAAAALYRSLSERHAAPSEWRAFPRCPLPLQALDRMEHAETPPLLRAYLKVGAVICSEPAWDPDFNSADILLLLCLDRIEKRYARHFLDPAGRAA